MSDRYNKTLVGHSAAHANLPGSIHVLRRGGFQPRDASVAHAGVVRDAARGLDSGQSTVEGAATGASAGAVVGGVLGWLAGTGSLGVLGMDAFIVIGPILASGAGAGVAGAVGGLLGGLVGLRSRGSKGQKSGR